MPYQDDFVVVFVPGVIPGKLRSDTIRPISERPIAEKKHRYFLI
jgi:hypothetical protein